MKGRFWPVAFLCVAAGTGAYFLFRSTSAPSGSPPKLITAESAVSTPPTKAAAAPVVAALPAAPQETVHASPQPIVSGPPPGPAGQLLSEPAPEGLLPATVLANMRRTVRQYGQMFGGNPVGTNPEITKALNGDNPRHIKFLTADGNRVNDNGELVDSWGTPYFFHQLSRTEMEIRSAGPDKIMYTGDDLVTK